MVAGKLNTFVWVHEEQATALRSMSDANADRESAWLHEQRGALGLSENQPTPEHLRLEILRLRPLQWPRQSHLVEESMWLRLSQPDLAGPWLPFTPRERESQRLSGRRPGTPSEKFGDKLALDLDPELVELAQLASHRISEPIVRQLHAENLLGPGRSQSRTSRLRREELQAKIYTLGRVVREAINLALPS
ncbi:hypothetical protein ACWCQL_24410 [Streptomyces sp. NPDC002073]